MHRFPILLLFAFGSAGPASARPKAAAALDVPSLESTLAAAGWTMTPERSATYAVGDIYSRSQNTPVLFNADCFNAEPRVGSTVVPEVVQAMKARVRVPLGVARVKAGAMEYKQRRFADPYVSQVGSMALNPSKSCRDVLARAPDPSDLIVITSVLNAEVKEQLCRSIDGGASIAGFGASAELQQECSQESDGHVVVAYMTRPWLEVLARAPLPERAVVPSVSVSTATASADFSEAAGLDMAGKLKLQRCKDAAREAGERIRAGKLEEARNAALQKATAAWNGLRSDLEQCIGLPADARVDCIRAVEDWLTEARSMEAVIASGEEVVETECGELASAFEAVQESFEAAEVADAEGLLQRLQIDAEASGATGLFALTFSAPSAKFDTLHVMCHVGGFAKGSAEAVSLPQAGSGPCRVDAFSGTVKHSATVVVAEGGHYHCSDGSDAGRYGAFTCALRPQ